MKVTMTLEGMQATQAALRRVPDVVQAHAGDAVGVTSFAVAQRARARVRVLTGRLKRAITSSSRGTSGRVGLSGDDPVVRLYWKKIEFGTVRQRPHPFLRPAADEESDAFVQRMRAIGPKVERDLSAGRFR